MKNSIIAIIALSALSAQGASLVNVGNTLVSTNNANFDLSVFDGQAAYNDRGVGGSEPGAPTFRNTLGDGTLLSYNLVGNAGTGSPLTSYASSGTRTPVPVADNTGPTTTHGNGEEWANVWVTTDPGAGTVFTGQRDAMPTGVAGAARTFARASTVNGTIDISGMASGQVYIPVGSYNNGFSLTLTMTGSAADLVADYTVANGVIGNSNNGWISEFSFTNEGQYDTINYEWRHNDIDGSRARFQGVMLDGEEGLTGDVDSDGDLLIDLWEDEFFGDNNGTVEPGDLTASDGTGDADADGATDLQEQNASSNPNVKDTDTDGLEDGEEINTYRSDPTLLDTDGDTLEDGEEVNVHGSDPTLVDTDGDTLTDDEETKAGVDTFITDPAKGDTDDDGVRDDLDTEPNDPDNDNDGDGLGNADETNVHGTDPLVGDSDSDGILDGEELEAGEDGFVTLPLEDDTDADGFKDGQEVEFGSDPTDSNSTPTGASVVALLDRVQVSANNANFDISVFPGSASYNDRGIGGTEPGLPTFLNLLGDGTVLDYNFIGNDGTGSALTSYADGGQGLLPTPTAPPENVHGPGEDWANVWTVTDPGVDGFEYINPKDHNPTNAIGAANTFARCAEVTGTVDISGLDAGTLYFPHGTFVNQWTLTLTMTGTGQPDLVALDTQVGNGPSMNFGWITSFAFVNKEGYDTITYNYTNSDRDGSRARFMGVILAAEADPSGPKVTEVIHTDTGDNILVDLIFNSKEGRTYSVFATSDMSLPLTSWLELEDSFVGQAGGSSTYRANFNLQGLPLALRQFFVIVENP